MPLGKGTRYRVVTRGKKKLRLAFRKGSNTVIETKDLSTGMTHHMRNAKKKRKRRKRTY